MYATCPLQAYAFLCHQGPPGLPLTLKEKRLFSLPAHSPLSADDAALARRRGQAMAHKLHKLQSALPQAQ